MKFIILDENTLAKFFLEDPKLAYQSLSDEELAVLKETSRLPIREGYYYIGLGYDKKIYAIFRWEHFSNTTMSGHIYVKSKYQRSQAVRDIFDLLKNHIINNTPFNKFITFVPDPCDHIKIFLEKKGFIKEASLSKTLKWREKLEDLHIYSLDVTGNK